MLRKLAEYQHNIHLRRPGAQKALEDFKAQQVGIVADIREVSSNFYPNMVELCSKCNTAQARESTVVRRICTGALPR
jgi:hypothetical protein